MSCDVTGAGVYARRPVFHPIANNGLIVGGSDGFLFDCISNSSQSRVGTITALDGSVLPTGSDQSTLTAEHPFNRPGIVRLQATAALITTINQSIYTCTIPDSNGNQFVINVGVYPNGFSSELLLYMCIHRCATLLLISQYYPSLYL